MSKPISNPMSKLGEQHKISRRRFVGTGAAATATWALLDTGGGESFEPEPASPPDDASPPDVACDAPASDAASAEPEPEPDEPLSSAPKLWSTVVAGAFAAAVVDGAAVVAGRFRCRSKKVGRRCPGPA